MFFSPSTFLEKVEQKSQALKVNSPGSLDAARRTAIKCRAYPFETSSSVSYLVS
jgi:hypothetical protein